MDNSEFRDNLFPSADPTSHWREEQDSVERHELQGLFALYAMTMQEQRGILQNIVEDMSADIVRTHVTRVNAEVQQLERWLQLPELGDMK